MFAQNSTTPLVDNNNMHKNSNNILYTYKIKFIKHPRNCENLLALFLPRITLISHYQQEFAVNRSHQVLA